jgi:alanine dehydrogenase
MFVGILKEIKAEENRVCMTPAGVEVMIANDHSFYAEERSVC